MPASYADHRAQLKAIVRAWGMPEDNAETTAEGGSRGRTCTVSTVMAFR
jgi:hypothetical protein